MVANLSLNEEEVKLDQQIDKHIAKMNVFAGEDGSYTMIYEERDEWRYSVFTDWF